LLRPKEIKRTVREIGRIPAERNTNYKILRRFEKVTDSDEELDKIEDISKFGSYTELVKIDKYKYQNPRKE
jgi:FO synthase subunit 2